MRIQYLQYWTNDEQTAMHDYAIPRGKMDLLRRTRSDRVQPLSSFVEVDLNMFTGWQWLMNDEMELQVCRPQLHGRENPALIKWRLSNGLTYAEVFRQQQAPHAAPAKPRSEQVTWDISAWIATHDVTNKPNVVACREPQPAHGDVQNMEEATSPAPSQD